MAFKDLQNFVEVQPIRIPIRGKVYEFPGEIGGDTWLLLQSVTAKAAKNEDLDAVAINDFDQERFMEELLGSARQELIDDKIPSETIKLVFRTLILAHTEDLETAEAFWDAMGKVPGPNRAARRASGKSTRKASRGGSTTGRSSATRTTET